MKPSFLRDALVGAIATALVFGTATALAGSGVGATFNLGQANTVNGTTSLSGTTAGPQLKVANASASANAFSVYGLLSAASAGTGSAAIRAESQSTSANGYGLWASQAGAGTGVFGTSATGIGVYGKHTSGGGSLPGVQGQSAAAGAPGVLAKNTGGGPGLAVQVNAGVAPLTVNSSTRVASLNSDLLDGRDSTYFLPTTGTAANASKLGGNLPSDYLPATGKAADSDKLDGVDSTGFASAAQSASISQSNTLISNANCTDIGGPTVTANVGDSGLIAVYAEASIFTPSGTFSIGLYDGTSCTQLLAVTSTNASLATLPGSNTGTSAPNPSWVVVHTTPGTHEFSLRASGSGGYGNLSLLVFPL